MIGMFYQYLYKKETFVVDAEFQKRRKIKEKKK